jgi:PD-(D/E)XK endonuclease
MNRPISIAQPSWTDDQLAEAIRISTNWRSVMRLLGFGERSKSAGAVRIVRRRAAELSLDCSHFRGKRRWSDAQLKQAAAESQTWEAAPVTAAAWFMHRGCAVSFPVEPAVYDLLADTPEGLMRVQVKSTTSYRKNEGWAVGVGHRPDTHAKKKSNLLAYSPEEIDLFFIIDGDMTMYLIPSRAIAGRITILLRTYRKYIVGNAQGLLGVADADGAACPTA